MTGPYSRNQHPVSKLGLRLSLSLLLSRLLRITGVEVLLAWSGVAEGREGHRWDQECGEIWPLFSHCLTVIFFNVGTVSGPDWSTCQAPPALMGWPSEPGRQGWGMPASGMRFSSAEAGLRMVWWACLMCLWCRGQLTKPGFEFQLPSSSQQGWGHVPHLL